MSLLNKTIEFTELMKKSTNLTVFLSDLAKLITTHMGSDSCSFFIYDDDTEQLTLQGTDGLSSEFIGKLVLKRGEGITGTVMDTLFPIKSDHAPSHPKFKPYPYIGEEEFQSLLAVPIRRGRNRIGVITLHKHEPSFFTVKDVTILMAIASQLASAVLSAGFLLSLKRKNTPEVPIKSPIEGIGASHGIVKGKSFLYNREQFGLDDRIDEGLHSSDTSKVYSLEDFDTAIEKTLEQLKQIEDQLGESLSDIAGLIFTAHYLMLKDPNFAGMMRDKIEEGMAADDAIRFVSDTYAQLMASTENPRIQEKEQDVRDLEHRMLANLYNKTSDHSDYSDLIIIAQNLYPSELVRFWVQKAKGIVLIGHGLTAHISILSRSLGIPLLLVNNRDILRLPNKSDLLVDATQGVLHIKPDKSVLNHYKDVHNESDDPIPADLPETTVTKDGRRIRVNVNVNILHDAEAGFERKAEGIGLYRSEFPFLIQNDFPSESQQYYVYEKICSIAGDKEVILRTLDIGGDKLPGYIDTIAEENPFLGFRGIRYSLEAMDIFHEQIKAMLRAGAETELKILFPMVSSLDEFLAAKEAVGQCLTEMAEGDTPYCKHPRLGAMIEIPSAIEIVEELAEEADFLSVGTNDLIMYLLAVDRGNERVGSLHTSFHPSVLRALNRLVDGIKKVYPNIDGYLSVCGDAAGDPLMLPFLIGIGIDSFSVEPAKLVTIKEVIGKISYEACKELSQRLIKARSTDEIVEILHESFPEYSEN